MLSAPEVEIVGSGNVFEIRHEGRVIGRAYGWQNACIRARTAEDRLQHRPAVCMCCQRAFTATSRWNRLCRSCKDTYA